MPNNHDAILLETVKTHRGRLLAAFLFGDLDERRIANDNVRRFVGSIVLAGVACAACVGVGLVTHLLADQAAQKAQQQQIGTPVSGVPTPIPSEAP